MSFTFQQHHNFPIKIKTCIIIWTVVDNICIYLKLNLLLLHKNCKTTAINKLIYYIRCVFKFMILYIFWIQCICALAIAYTPRTRTNRVRLGIRSTSQCDTSLNWFQITITKLHCTFKKITIYYWQKINNGILFRYFPSIL